MKKIHIHMLDLKSYYSSPAYQLGLLASYASVEKEVEKNVTFTFTEHPREQPAQEIVKTIMETGADLIAASNYAWNYNKICKILEILTKTDAGLPWIVLGGPNSEGKFGEATMKEYPIISAMVQGEGEPAFRDICCSLVDSPSKNPFINSRNCVTLDKAGDAIRLNMNHRIQLLDDVPSPYLMKIIPVQPSPIFYETNRGCPYRCSFCYWGNGNSRIYRMSLKRIREEMEFFAKNKVSAFWMADANFGIFKEDAEIAEMMCDINSRNRYPFKTVGVNWAKNSNDRVLEIAEIFRRGRMECTTTLALQSVTPEAEEKSKRYSMSPSKFTKLIRSAHEKNIDTYTDLIWGLPGETINEYLNGIDSVIMTGLPAIKIHQLYLLPGTEFYDERERFGFKMLSDVGGINVDESERSDYWNYIVVSHPKMSREDMKRGNRLLAINHFIHNHDLGKIVNFFLIRYGISHKEVYNFFDELILGKVEGFPEERHEFLSRLRELILTYAENTGIDEFTFYHKLSNLIWHNTLQTRIKRNFNDEVVRGFMHDFYEVFCRKHCICSDPEDMDLLKDFIDYNVLVSPKPAWKPKSSYSFKYNVHAIWQDILYQIHKMNDNGNGTGNKAIKREKQGKESWADFSPKVRYLLAKLLTDDYIKKMQGPVTYTVKNTWLIPPSSISGGTWLINSGSRHCIIETVN